MDSTKIPLCFIALFFMFSCSVNGDTSYDPNSLDGLVRANADLALRRQRTGTVNNIILPANFSGIGASVLALRSSSFWARGANLSSIYIPPRIIPSPYVKRIAFLYENLGNWSSYYFRVPKYRLVAPVLGFMAYDASNLTWLGTKKLDFSFNGDPISISFDQEISHDLNLKCVVFGDDGSVQLKNLTSENTCLVQLSHGHFSVVAPSVPSSQKENKRWNWKWWVVGFLSGFVGLSLIGLVVLIIRKLVRRKQIAKMENVSDNGVPIDEIWIGRSKMPSATMVRTQPEIEHHFAP